MVSKSLDEFIQNNFRVPPRSSSVLFRGKSGQVLLIAVLLIATALTVTLTLTLKSTTDTQLTKLEEESQKTLSAAEAAVEAALKQGTIADFNGLGDLSSSFTGSATVATAADANFLSPVLHKDQAYTVYLSSPQNDEGVLDFNTLTPSYNGNIHICFGSSYALELTLIKSSGAVKRFVINPSNADVVSGTNLLKASSTAANPPGGCSFDETTFSSFYLLTQAALGNDNTVFIMKILSPNPLETRIGLKGSSPLPAQGKTIVSEAKANGTNVSKKIQLFQSFPQLPAEFFTTSF